MKSSIFVTGTGTDVGKTFCAALLVEKLQCDYWKPIQCGLEQGGDCAVVASLISNNLSRIYSPAHSLQAPLSPDEAAAREDIEIELSSLEPPASENGIVIEGAGGALVPINGSILFADYIKRLGIPAVIVSRGYLGAINHTLLTVEGLKARKIPILGIIFNGNFPPGSKESILRFSELPVIAELPELDSVDRKAVAALSKQIKL